MFLSRPSLQAETDLNNQCSKKGRKMYVLAIKHVFGSPSCDTRVRREVKEASKLASLSPMGRLFRLSSRLAGGCSLPCSTAALQCLHIRHDYQKGQGVMKHYTGALQAMRGFTNISPLKGSMSVRFTAGIWTQDTLCFSRPSACCLSPDEKTRDGLLESFSNTV